MDNTVRKLSISNTDYNFPHSILNTMILCRIGYLLEIYDQKKRRQRMGLSKEQLDLVHKEQTIDYEIYELIHLINKVEGITTTLSCFGHNTEPIQIYCVADSIECLNKFIYDYFYCNSLVSFKLLVTDTTIDNEDWSKIEFVIESDTRYVAYPCTQLIADNLTRTFREKLIKEAHNDE